MKTNIDATKLTDLPADSTVSILPASALYRVENDKMYAIHRKAILKDDLITVVIKGIDELERARTYVITDLAGNTFLGLLSRSADAIKIRPRNRAYPVIKLAVNDIRLIERVYKIQRNVMSDADLEEIIKREDEYNAAIAAGKEPGDVQYN